MPQYRYLEERKIRNMQDRHATMSSTYRRNVTLAISLLIGGSVLLICGVNMYLKDDPDTSGEASSYVLRSCPALYFASGDY